MLKKNYLFGSFFRDLRLLSGLSQSDLSRKISVSKSLISKIENNERKLDKSVLENFSKELMLSKYDDLKLKILSEQNVETSDLSFLDKKIIIKLSNEFKNSNLNNYAKKLIYLSIPFFGDSSDLFSLLSTISLLEKNYESSENYIKIALEKYDSAKNNLIDLFELNHNFGNVYFERSIEIDLLKSKLAFSLLEKNSKVNYQEDKEFAYFTNKQVNDLKKAEKLFIKSYKTNNENQHIVDQLSRLYYHQGAIFDNSEKYFLKSEKYYNKLLSFDEKLSSDNKLEASIFLSMIKAKLSNFDSALEIINIIINLRPEYILAYYVKSLIYCFIGKLDKSIYFLEKSIKLDPSLKNTAKLDLDFFDLKYSKKYNKIFMELLD